MKPMKETAEERADRLESEIASLREQLNKSVSKFPDGTQIELMGQFVNDPTEVKGLRADLYPFWAASSKIHPKHPHNEAGAIRMGYRRATVADFDPVDEMSAQLLFDLTEMGGPGESVLYVCSMERREMRLRREQALTAASMNKPPLQFRNPVDGSDATHKM